MKNNFTTEELMIVLHYLRHDCKNISRVKEAVEFISKKTNIDKTRVEEIIIHMCR